jgi:nicotinamidase-related amidase
VERSKAYLTKDSIASERYGVVMSNALIVIDVQNGFNDPAFGARNNPDCEENVRRLLAHWRENGHPVVLVRHDSTYPGSPLEPGQPGNDLKAGIDGPHDLFITKSTNSAFYGSPDLDGWLKSNGITSVTICGITTDHCCSTTARMADNLGYSVDFVLDATHTHDRTSADGSLIPADDVARVNAASLDGEFARVITTTEAIKG